MTSYTPSGWWNRRAQFRQHLQTAPQPLPKRKPLALPTLPMPTPVAAPALPVKPTADQPCIAKVLRRLRAGAQIESTPKGYRFSDKGHGKVRSSVFDYLYERGYIGKGMHGGYVLTFKAKGLAA